MDAPFHDSDRRDPATAHRQRALYDAYVRSRQFERAAAVRAAHPALGLPEVPRLVEPAGANADARTALFAAADRGTLERRAIDLDDGARLLVAFHPACRHSLAAYRAIAADPLLSRMFAERAAWIAPVDAMRDLDVFRRWAAAHPAAPVGIAYAREEWAGIALSATPTFHFLVDGRVAGTVDGGARLAERLLAALNVHGWIAGDGAQRPAAGRRRFDPLDESFVPAPAAFDPIAVRARPR